MVKVMRTSDIAEMGGRTVARVMRMGKLETPQEWTEMAVSAIEFDIELAAGIFTKDNARALRVTKAIHAGIVWVNTNRVVSPIAEFGGFKESGYGRESGMQAVYDYTRPKTIWINTSDEPLSNPFVMR